MSGVSENNLGIVALSATPWFRKVGTRGKSTIGCTVVINFWPERLVYTTSSVDSTNPSLV
eukprot:8520882-Lingulodinium_polyedra.AAC.1